MSWLLLLIMTFASVLVLALITHLIHKRKHWAVQWSAIILCGFALYCFIKADINGEIHELSQRVAGPFVKEFLQPFALSNVGKGLMKALQLISQVLEHIIVFIDDHPFSLVIGIAGLIYFVQWVRNKRNR